MHRAKYRSCPIPSGRTWLSSCKKPQRPARTSRLYCLCRKTGWQITDSHLRSFHSSHKMCRKRFRFPGGLFFDESAPLSVPASSAWHFRQISPRISRAWRFSALGRNRSIHLCRIPCKFCRDCHAFGNIIKKPPHMPHEVTLPISGTVSTDHPWLSRMPFPIVAHFLLS